MTQCRKCEKDIIQSKDGCKCVDCQTVFHVMCVSDTVKRRGSQKNWKCEDCAFDSTSSKSGGDRDLGNAQVLDAISSLRSEMITRWDGNDTKLEELQKDINKVDNKIVAMKVEFDHFKTQANETQGKVEKLSTENKRLQEELSAVKLVVEDLQQHTRKNNIVITGIPALPRGSDVFWILREIAKLLDIEYYRSEINAAHWLPAREGDPKTQSIVVSFVSRLMKNDWISARRRRGSLKATEIDAKFPNIQVYVNEQLTPETRVIFNRARALMKEGKLTSVWTSDGRVMAKRSPAGNPFRVRSLQDLQQQKGPAAEPAATATIQQQ